MAGARRADPVTAHTTCRCSTGNHGRGAITCINTVVKEFTLIVGNNGSMSTRDHLAYTSLDVIDETSAQSFPASDAPGWAIGRGYWTTHRSRDVDQCSYPVRKEEGSCVSNGQQDDSAPLFR